MRAKEAIQPERYYLFHLILPLSYLRHPRAEKGVSADHQTPLESGQAEQTTRCPRPTASPRQSVGERWSPSRSLGGRAVYPVLFLSRLAVTIEGNAALRGMIVPSYVHHSTHPASEKQSSSVTCAYVFPWSVLAYPVHPSLPALPSRYSAAAAAAVHHHHSCPRVVLMVLR